MAKLHAVSKSTIKYAYVYISIYVYIFIHKWRERKYEFDILWTNGRDMDEFLKHLSSKNWRLFCVNLSSSAANARNMGFFRGPSFFGMWFLLANQPCTGVIVLPTQTMHFEGQVHQNYHTCASFDHPQLGTFTDTWYKKCNQQENHGIVWRRTITYIEF